MTYNVFVSCCLQRLELVARVQLAHYLQLPLSEVPASISEYTTTDIAAACSAAGLLLVKGGKKTVRGCLGAVGMASEGWVGGKEGGREGGRE
jgi:hypothetical protein